MYGVARALSFRNPVASSTCVDHVICSYWGMNFPHTFQRRSSKQVRNLKLYLVQELGEGTRINPFMVLQVVHMRGRGSLGKVSHSSRERKRTHLAKGFRALDEAAVIPDDGYNLFHLPSLRRDTG